MKEFNKNLRAIVKDFDNIPLKDIKKPRVGVVGEILVKFLPAANNYLVDLLEAEGAEAVVPDIEALPDCHRPAKPSAYFCSGSLRPANRTFY